MDADRVEEACLEALAEGPKYAPEIYFWVMYERNGGEHLPRGALLGALRTLLAARLVEEFRSPGFHTSPLTRNTVFLTERYRLTADGFLKSVLAASIQTAEV